MKNQKDLVVFFSRSGRTRKLAEDLAGAFGADLDEIRESRSRAGVLGFLRSGYEAVKKVEPVVMPPVHDPRDYRRVFIGGPVWAGHPCSPVRAYLARHRRELPDVAFFCTYGGHGADTALAEMAALLGRKAAATLAVLDREIDGGRESVEPIVKTLRPAH